MERLCGADLREVIVKTRKSFMSTDWGPNASTEADRYALVLRLLKVQPSIYFDEDEATAIVAILLLEGS